MFITSFCKIELGKIKINNQVDFVNLENIDADNFFISAYKHYQISYPKFHKMDSLCKLALIASEILMKQTGITNIYDLNKISIVLSNSASSLEIDTVHQKTISDKQNYFPSPANFVYTLPNIMIGEIAIRNKIKGENIFLVSEKFDSRFMCDYVNSLFNTNDTQCAVAGWIDVFENNYSAFLYTIESQNKKLNLKHIPEELNKLWLN